MTEDEFAKVYDGYTREQQACFLAGLAHEITIRVRGYYSTQPQIVNSNPGSIVGNLNEVQHRVAGVLCAVLRDDPERPSGSELFDLLLSWAGDDYTKGNVIYAIEGALSRH